MSSSSESSGSPPPKKRAPLKRKPATKKQTSANKKLPIPIEEQIRLSPAKNEPQSPSTSSNLAKKCESDRMSTAKSVLEFDFKKKRIRILSNVQSVPETCGAILYWMARDVRVQDNWALLYAQKLALKNRVPLHICFCFVPTFLDGALRHYKFLMGGLAEVRTECCALDIQFHLLEGEPSQRIPKIVKDHNIGGIVCDVWPLRLPRKWLDDLLLKLPASVAVCQVDGHNIVPLWETSEKQEYAARTIRNKVNKQLDVYLQHFPPVIRHPHAVDKNVIAKHVDWKRLLDSADVDRTVDEVIYYVDCLIIRLISPLNSR